MWQQVKSCDMVKVFIFLFKCCYSCEEVELIVHVCIYIKGNWWKRD